MTDDFDLAIRGGTVVTETQVFRADVGIRGGRIAAVGENLAGRQTIEADGLLVMPGGVDTHCHLDQVEPGMGYGAEDFVTGSRSALAGGTTTAISFVAQFKGEPIRDVLAETLRRGERSIIDYSFHQIVTDPTDAVLAEIPAIVASGIRSLKVFLTYDGARLDDRQFLRVLAAARREGAMVAVHCENYDAIGWLTEQLLAAGLTAPKYHAWSRPKVVERETTYRAIALAELVDTPIQVFHVSCAEVAEEIARAKRRGLKVWGETCPQYFALTAADMDRPGFEGSKAMCSPAPRDEADHEGLWEMMRQGVLDVVSSDHSAFNTTGHHAKDMHGRDASFRDIPNGVPGVGSRLPLLFSEGVVKGRIDLPTFVALTAANPARIYGLGGRKGTIAPGADADIVLWDPGKRVTLTNALLQHAVDYTPYEGREVTGWPVMTIRRGIPAMREGKLLAEEGSGRFLPRGPYDLARPLGRLANGFDAARAQLA
ncbi:dihydropyrimidinase [Labrys wisconsinensis]|uniref:Dihydropyrimidinase n=1 Tax=Labrys wisconsinensis TaxID=425677 RepID=A0ABU0JD30_9HYPH|nr:dihydropyrimidinase [Labrys wisconsinensis]MDQ0472197.1 dihydropyrimidinase [Labrys wisconsinensis]